MGVRLFCDTYTAAKKPAKVKRIKRPQMGVKDTNAKSAKVKISATIKKQLRKRLSRIRLVKGKTTTGSEVEGRKAKPPATKVKISASIKKRMRQRLTRLRLRKEKKR